MGMRRPHEQKIFHLFENARGLGEQQVAILSKYHEATVNVLVRVIASCSYHFVIAL